VKNKHIWIGLLKILPLLIVLSIAGGLIAYVEKTRALDKKTVVKDLNTSLPKQATLVEHEDGPLFQSYTYSLPEEADSFKIMQSYCAFFEDDQKWREILKRPTQDKESIKCSLLTKETYRTQHLIFCMGSRNRLEISITTNKSSLGQGDFLKLFHNGRPAYPVSYCFH